VDKALPVWVSGSDRNGHRFEQTARVVDISRRGARLEGISCLRAPGDIIEIRYGRKSARFGVVWIDDVRGQAGICCTEPDKSIWGVTLPSSPPDSYQPSVPPPAGAVPVKAAAPSAAPPAQRSARKHPRFHCVAGVTVRTTAFPRPIWGRVTDIGMGGCFVEAGSSLEPQTGVELLISGLEVRPKGVVRYALPGRGIGIMFREVNDSVRQDLERFLAGVSRPGGVPGGSWGN